MALRAEEREYQLTPPDFLSDRLPRLVREAVDSGRITLNRGADMVVDKDHWTDEQLRQLHEWSQQHTLATDFRRYYGLSAG